MILCDTDIFIEALKNNSRAVDMLRYIGLENIALSAITVMELYFGAVNK
jgi:tRNA(fMet)-specific endonuclease VapC